MLVGALCFSRGEQRFSVAGKEFNVGHALERWLAQEIATTVTNWPAGQIGRYASLTPVTSGNTPPHPPHGASTTVAILMYSCPG
jgi:hypothetical protein